MAKLKNINVKDTGFLQLPVGTTNERPEDPEEGMVRFNKDLNKIEFYNGSIWKESDEVFPEAIGGTIVDTDINGISYRIHLFTDVGSFNFNVIQGGEIDYLIVAGGGGGGGTGSGGGGAGGLLAGTIDIKPGTYNIVVGAGGNGGRAWNNSPQNGTNGENSSAFGLVAVGGGASFRSANSSSGGSGGGADRNTQPGQGIDGQGHRGGFSSFGNGQATGGGGGAGSPGEDARSSSLSGRGGIGILSQITGNPQWYAGGGGGGIYASVGEPGRGGLGGGGDGGSQNNILNSLGASDGSPNTGGGGGGGGYTSAGGNIQGGGNGGSGIVVVRYRKNKKTEINSDRNVFSTLPNTSEKWNLTEVQRFVPATTPRVLIHAESEGLNNTNGFRTTRVDINGETFINASTPRNLRITRLRRNGTGWRYVESRTYDGYGTAGATNNALNFLREFQSKEMLILTTYDHIGSAAPSIEPLSFLSSELNTYFFSKAGIDFTIANERAMYLIIAIKNERLFYENFRNQNIPGFTVSLWLE